jgi:hypothetical protein
LNKRYFPYVEKSGWESNFTDFMFAAFQMNTYTLWHEHQNLKDNLMDYKTFTINLYRSLMNLDFDEDVWREGKERERERSFILY